MSAYSFYVGSKFVDSVWPTGRTRHESTKFGQTRPASAGIAQQRQTSDRFLPNSLELATDRLRSHLACLAEIDQSRSRSSHIWSKSKLGRPARGHPPTIARTLGTSSAHDPVNAIGCMHGSATGLVYGGLIRGGREFVPGARRGVSPHSASQDLGFGRSGRCGGARVRGPRPAHLQGRWAGPARDSAVCIACVRGRG